PTGVWARTASDLGIPDAVEEPLGQIPDNTLRAGLVELIDVLGSQGLDRQPSQVSREQILKNITMASPDGAAMVMFFRICSRETWEGWRSRPCEPSTSISSTRPARSVLSGICPSGSSTASGMPRSEAVLAHTPVG